MGLDEKVNAFSEDMADLWKVHCFREGNTRTTVIFCCDFAEAHGFPMDRDLLANNSKYVRNSLVAASAIFSDLGDLRQPEHLRVIIKDSMQRGAALAKQNPQMSMDNWKDQIAQEKERNKGNTANEKNKSRDSRDNGAR